MFKIGDFSKFTKVSVRMLRYYDEVGLFKPAQIDDFTGYRYYSANTINIIFKHHSKIYGHFTSINI